MPLKIEDRLWRLRNRLEELTYWFERQSVAIDGWTIDGEPIAVGGAWPSRKGMHRFVATASVPQDWPLESVRLRLNVGGESLLHLDFGEAGKASYGLDPNHQEFAVKGRDVAILTESVARLPFGQPVRSPSLEEARFVWFEMELRAFHLLVSQVEETANILKDEEVAPHLVELAEEALRAIDWPSATQDYVAMTAGRKTGQRFAGLQTIWELPEVTDTPAGLTDQHRASIVAAHTKTVAALKALKDRFPNRGKIAVTGHAHIDLAWLWPYGETRNKVRRTFSTAANLMAGSEDFRFNQSTAAYYAQIEEEDPGLLTAIRARIAEGKWETVGGMWVEPDTNMPTGESLARQVLYGQRYFEKTFGTRHDVCWLPDCFGFSGGLPQILLQGGLRSFFTIKVNWSETNRFPADLFWWEGIDGSRVLTHTFDNPVEGYNGYLRPNCITPTWRNFRGKTLHDETLLCVGFGDGGGGVTQDMLDREVQLRDFPGLPEVSWTKVTDFYARLHETAQVAPVPAWAGEIYLESHRATLTTQSHTKRLHRQAERALITAEVVASLGHMLGGAAPKSLENVWRVVLKNEFHDILPGSSIHEVYEDAERELTEARDAGLKAQVEGLIALTGLLPKGDVADGLMVVNPSLHARHISLALMDGSALSSEQVVPPMSVRVLARGDIQAASQLSVSETHLENAYLRAEIGADGSITSLIHKATGRDALSGHGNQLWVYTQDKPRHWDAWDVEEDYSKSGVELTSVDSIEVLEAGLHRAAVRVVRTFRQSRITQVYVLGANARRIDIETEIDWHDRRVLLRTLTPVSVKSEMATYECAFGVVRRTTHDNTSWDWSKFEVPGHRFADLSEPGFGVALMNTGKYGHSVRGNVLGLSLVRGPVYPDPMADEGLQRFTYALYPHDRDWHDGGVREEAEDLNQPLLAAPVTGLAAGTWSALGLEGIPTALGALKPAEDGEGLILRVYEPSGRRGALSVAVPEGWTVSGPLSILEEPWQRKGPEDLMPFEVRSWRLTQKDQPLA